jgi:hypothetical protein
VETTAEGRNLARRMARWLRGLGHTQATPVAVLIERKKFREIYYGARYVFTGTYEAGMLAVADGRVSAGDTWTSARIELAGKKPRTCVRNRQGEQKIVYTIAGDVGDWYVSHWYERGDGWDRLNRELKKYHPFGPNFGLTRWDHEELGDRIDRHRDKPAERLRIEVEEICRRQKKA